MRGTRKRHQRAFSARVIGLAAVGTLLAVIGAGALFDAVESQQDLSTWDGIWWAVGQMTTAGSDIYPRTDTGRFIAIFVVIVGLGFVALFTAALAERFLGQEFEEEVAEAEAEQAADTESLLHSVREVKKWLAQLERDLERRAGKG